MTSEPRPGDMHRLTTGNDPRGTAQWLRDHGCRVILVAALPYGGVVFQNGPHAMLQMAVPGDTLIAHTVGGVHVEPAAP